MVLAALVLLWFPCLLLPCLLCLGYAVLQPPCALLAVSGAMLREERGRSAIKY